VDPVNDEPSFTTLGDQTVDEDSGPHTVAGFATPAPGGGADESGQTFSYNVSNDNAGLFLVGPAIDANGQLTYTLNSDVNGTATVTVSVTDSGGTPNGGDDTSPDQTFDIIVDAVNDEPSFTTLGDQTVDEDSGPHTVAGFATPAPGGGADESGQTFTYAVSNDNAGLFAVGPAIDANGQLTYTLNSNVNGTATVTVSVTDSGGTPNGGDDTSPDQTFDIIVDAVNDEPSFTTLGDQTVDEDSGPHTVANFATPAPGGGADESGQTFTYSVSNDNAGLFAVGPAIDANGQLTYTLAANAVGTATVTVSVTDSGGTANGGDDTSPDQTFDITVNSVLDTPSVTNATTFEDIQTSSGLVLTPNAADGAEVTHFKITGISNGSLYLNDGTTVVNNGDFITTADGGLGLRFTPTANSFASGSFDAQASSAANDGGLGGGVVSATITVNPVADTPSVTNATTPEDTQSTSGLVLTRNVADGAEVTHFKITGISDGTLYYNDGTTVINNGDFITVAAGGLGLKFTPALNSTVPGSFNAQASLANNDAGLGGLVIAATINVFPLVADTPSVSNAATLEDTQTTSGLVITRNPADGPEITHFKITGIAGGTLYLNDGTTAVNNGDFISDVAAGLGLRFTPTLDSNASGRFDVQASTANNDAGLGGSLAAATITVSPVADTPSVSNATTLEDTQSTSGLVLTRNAADGAEVSHFKITGIAGGALYLNDGTTAINNGDFITVADGGLGLKFTPAPDSTAPGSFDAQASLIGNDTGLGGALAQATIIVNAVNDEPSFTTLGDQTVDEDSGPHTVAGFATPAPGGGADESGQTFSYSVSNDNAGLFAVGPAIDANGQLTYTLNADAAGTATVTVSVTETVTVAVPFTSELSV